VTTVVRAVLVQQILLLGLRLLVAVAAVVVQDMVLAMVGLAGRAVEVVVATPLLRLLMVLLVLRTLAVAAVVEVMTVVRVLATELLVVRVS
jgi:hypothetical protein